MLTSGELLLMRVLSLGCVLVCAAVAGDSLGGQTPCCEDRLTTIVCNRQKQQNAAIFIHKCIKNPDFALVQCCRTCFGQRDDDPYKLDYAKTIGSLLTDPLTSHCTDRRSREWCELFAQKHQSHASGVPPPMPSHERGRVMDCSNVPVAFRLCRLSCGYCSTGAAPSNAIYDYSTARDPIKCYNPSKGLAQKRMDMKEVYRDFATRFSNAPSPVPGTTKGIKRSRGKNLISKYRRKPPTSRPTTTTTTTTTTAGPTASRRRKSEIEDLWGYEVELYSPNDYFVVMDHDYDWS